MKITNKQKVPDVLYKALIQDTYQKEGDFSATEIVGPPRIRILKKVHYHQLIEDCSEHIFRLFGSLIHELMKLADVQNALQEERLTALINGVTLSGQPDIYDDFEIVWDFKVTSRWVAVFGAKEDWEPQLNIYAYLLGANGFPTKGAKVCAIFRDWSKTQAVKDRDYPQHQVKVFPIKLWSKAAQRAYIERRIKLHQTAEKMPVGSLPFCTSGERWEKQTKYAVMKKGRKSAVRVLDSHLDGVKHIQSKGLDTKQHSITKRLGESTRCEYYCMVKDFCNQYKLNVKGKP